MFEKCINGLMQMADNDDDKMLNYGELMPLILGSSTVFSTQPHTSKKVNVRQKL